MNQGSASHPMPCHWQRLILFTLLAFSTLLPFYTNKSHAAAEPISIQLKWKHSFQFAGYYAAIEKGFYQDAGLDVTLKEADLSRDYVEQVISGESEYGVSDSTLLTYHLKGRPVMLLKIISVWVSLHPGGLITGSILTLCFQSKLNCNLPQQSRPG